MTKSGLWNLTDHSVTLSGLPWERTDTKIIVPAGCEVVFTTCYGIHSGLMVEWVVQKYPELVRHTPPMSPERLYMERLRLRRIENILEW